MALNHTFLSTIAALLPPVPPALIALAMFVEELNGVTAAFVTVPNELANAVVDLN